MGYCGLECLGSLTSFLLRMNDPFSEREREKAMDVGETGGAHKNGGKIIPFTPLWYIPYAVYPQCLKTST